MSKIVVFYAIYYIFDINVIKNIQSFFDMSNHVNKKKTVRMLIIFTVTA